MLVAILLQAGTAQSLPRDVWASLSWSASLAHTSRTVGFLRPESSLKKDTFKLRLTTRRFGDPPPVFVCTR